MKQYGFTLIELLAVIIILALLMIFVFPSVINSIKKSSETIDQKNLDLIYNAVDVYISKHKSDFPKKSGNQYVIELKDLVADGLLVTPIKLSNKGEDITNSKSIQVTYTNDFKYEIKNNEDCKIKYSNGTVVYFDVKEGKVCKEKDYKVANSKTGYNGITPSTNQTSCLKFYAFLDESDDKLNLLLDHNTRNSAVWTKKGVSNQQGPDEVIDILKEDTNTWKGTETLSNYTLTQSVGGKYTINYETDEYNARLISAQEIAKITSADINLGFDEQSTSSYNFFDFDGVGTNWQTESETCKVGNTSGCKYGWLYDRTSSYCLEQGCLNDSNELTDFGYWTSTSTYLDEYSAWYVAYQGRIREFSVSKGLGVRPVIEISKEKLK